jgi:glutathione S-transferase
MLSPDTDGRLFAKKVEVVADAICDSLVLMFFEKQRAAEAHSKELVSRQQRKVDGGIKQLAQWAKGKEFMAGGKLELADVVAGCVLGYLDVRWPDYRWRDKWPDLEMLMG